MRAAKQVLLIAFRYPPFAGVGANRWSKLSKYLARDGYQVHVVTVPWEQLEANTFSADVDHPNIAIHRTFSGFPHVRWHRYAKNREWDKIKVIRKYFHRQEFRGADLAGNWKYFLIPKAERLIRKHGIQTVVCTGCPFAANRWAAELKLRNPQIRLIQDFRDVWASNTLVVKEEADFQAIKRTQDFCVEAADVVVSVTQPMLDTFVTTDAWAKKGVVVENGYDPDIVASAKALAPSLRDPAGKGLTFTYIGTTSSGREEPLERFLQAVEKLGPEFPGIKVKLIGNEKTKRILAYQQKLGPERLEVLGFLPQDTAMGHLAASDFALHVNARAHGAALSTKIYENAALKLPTFSVNYGEAIKETIEDRDLGVSAHAETDDVEALLRRFLLERERPYRFDVEAASFPNLAASYARLISEPLGLGN